MNERLTVVAGSSVTPLAEKIAAENKTPLVGVITTNFNDGESKPSIDGRSIRGDKVFVVQSTFAPAENLHELLKIGDAAKRASAQSIIAVIPYFGDARQDKKDGPRVPITAKLNADLIQAAGYTRIITMDLHADQIQGFFNIPVDHLYASAIFVPHIQRLNLQNLTMASPDTGGTRRAGKYANFLNVDMVVCYKNRVEANKIKEMKLIGDVKDKDVVFVDDIVDTAGTLTKASNLVMEKGARSVRAFCTHPVLSGDACKLIEESALEELYVTDTIPLKCESNKIKVLSTAKLFSEAIMRVLTDTSVSTLFYVV